MHAGIRWLDVLFGRGDDNWPFWLLAVRVDILLFVLCVALTITWHLRPTRLRAALTPGRQTCVVLALTLLAGALRFLVEHNVTALGGIGYSRILLGYQGHFGTAQLYSLVYNWTSRDLEHAILLNRIASTLAVPLVYALCRCLAPNVRTFPLFAAALLALHPLHLLFTPTDGLPVSTSLVAVVSYLLLVHSVVDAQAPAGMRTVSAAGAAAGLALLTQIRYENILFLAPVLVYLFVRRRALPVGVLAPGGLLFACFMTAYSVAAMGSVPSLPSALPVPEGLRAAAGELFGNPIFALGPVLIGTAAATFCRRSRVRGFAPLPLLALVPLIALAIALERHDYRAGFVPLARVYANQVLLFTLVTGYGVALLWESPRRGARVVAAGCLVWAGLLPVLFWPNLRERYLEAAEHDFFRASLASLPSEVDRIVVPDDDLLERASHSTIETMNKYRMIAGAAGTQGIALVGMTHFLEHPGDVDCSRSNCLFFAGLPCTGMRYYWFAEAQCAQLMESSEGPPVREEETITGSFLDCSIYRGAARRRICEPVRKPQRFALYRVTP